ncbi:RNA polymerase I-specific transcription initiation factor rrn5 [Tolypocladium paradoxum]|uniref:RNA polymerase I-specific transcription initiation factor rrn5 n=1 Tax=Tolypocladium paradoxum TaxID=94208 RepID=A0A2S4LAJ4_9HYPO|nr:RNA polymerase I-specific transcription initiation factor rrn5 [Tolypocladium paradoxum]
MDPDNDHSVDGAESVQGVHDSDVQVKVERQIYSPGWSSADDNSDELSSENGGVSACDDPSLGEGLGERSHRKRPAGDAATYRPFKRHKGILNTEYIELLNRDIDDAAHRVCLDDDFNLGHSQIGLTTWSPLEKRQFFEALARLGRHNLPGIASRVNSKSLVEIQHYINFLQDAQGRRRQFDRRSILETAEYPAAVELSQRCCHAQEEASDAVSLRQEQKERQREETKWGSYWDITPRIAVKLDQGQDADVNQPLPFAQLFHLSRWLRLSDRFFMNSSIPGSNWNYIDDVPPSMWATTFEDFYSLAMSVTRRLVQATLFISMSRIRAKRELFPNTRDIVRRKDVEAAIASLGMPPNAQHHWLKSARRLRLDVYREPPDRDEEADQEPMTYDEVETALSDEQDGDGPKQTKASIVTQDSASSSSSSSSSSDDGDEVTTNDSDEEKMTPEDEEEQEINREANEILWYSAAGLRDVQGARQALKRRIAMERRQEEQADRRDEHASYQAETAMWSVLQKKPPMDIPKKQDPGRPERSNLDVESIYPVRRDWASQLQYCGEWETLDESNNQEA